MNTIDMADSPIQSQTIENDLDVARCFASGNKQKNEIKCTT